MSLPEHLTLLLDLKTQAEAAEAAYETQRLTVREALDEANLTSTEHEGFRISRSEDRIVRAFDQELLREQLAAQGLSPETIHSILQNSRSENVQKGVLRITPLTKPSS